VLTHVTATRYVTPLREGGSLPGLMEADDLGTYVVKFHGAGQGRKALVAEVVSAVIARALGLQVPDLVTVQIDPALAPGEPDQEVQDLLRASGGLNLGVDYLPGALDFDPAAFGADPALAGRVLWFDALVQNADRSWRNPNLLFWHRQLRLIDHGATLTFQHRWASADAAPARPYDARDHALVEVGPDVSGADARLGPLVTDEMLDGAVAEVPDEWLAGEPGFAGPDAVRRAFVAQLRARLAARDRWLPGLVESAARRGRDREATVPKGRSRPAWLSGPGAAAL
jgi:hypothetical protein